MVGSMPSIAPRKLRPSVHEVHVAILGMNGCGKSALTVKYITKRFITEYDPTLEDTYCKHDVVQGQEVMVWLMDTVEGPSREASRYLSWADVFVVLYSITSSASFEYARHLLTAIARHDHTFCPREHTTLLLGNKIDLDRYRQVSKTQGARLANEMKAEFFELNTTEEYVLVRASAINLLSGYGASDSEGASSAVSLSLGSAGKSGKAASVSAFRRSKSPAARSHDLVKSASGHSRHAASNSLPAPLAPPKKSAGLRLFKLFNQ